MAAGVYFGREIWVPPKWSMEQAQPRHDPPHPTIWSCSAWEDRALSFLPFPPPLLFFPTHAGRRPKRRPFDSLGLAAAFTAVFTARLTESPPLLHTTPVSVSVTIVERVIWHGGLKWSHDTTLPVATATLYY